MPVGALEQVAQRQLPVPVRAPSADMLRPVVAEMAALAQGTQVAEGRVLRVVVEMGRTQMEAPSPDRSIIQHVRPRSGPAAIVAPGPRRLVPPAPVRELQQHAPMRPAAGLTAAARPLKA